MKLRVVLLVSAKADVATEGSRPKTKQRCHFFFLAVFRLGVFFFAAFFVAFFAAFFVAFFFVVFFLAAFFFVAFFLAAFLVVVFLAAFFVAFLATFFLATFFLATFFLATFFLAITLLLQADHKRLLSILTLLDNTKIARPTDVNTIMRNSNNFCHVLYRPFIPKSFIKTYLGDSRAHGATQ